VGTVKPLSLCSQSRSRDKWIYPIDAWGTWEHRCRIQDWLKRLWLGVRTKVIPAGGTAAVTTVIALTTITTKTYVLSWEKC